MGLSSSDAPVRRDPLVFAHRGSSHALPEHTLAAYLRAVDEGADGLECDVRLTRDRHLVCLHDRRLERTSNGRGPVSEHTLADAPCDESRDAIRGAVPDVTEVFLDATTAPTRGGVRRPRRQQSSGADSDVSSAQCDT